MGVVATVTAPFCCRPPLSLADELRRRLPWVAKNYLFVLNLVCSHISMEGLMIQDAELFRIVYYSFSLLASESAGDNELQNILEVSRARNRLSGITGALRYDGIQFLQVLEGPRGPVVATMARILRDLRHTRINIIEIAPLAQRDFADWSLALVPEHSISMAGLTNPDLIDIRPATGAQAAEALRTLLAMHRA